MIGGRNMESTSSSKIKSNTFTILKENDEKDVLKENDEY